MSVVNGLDSLVFVTFNVDLCLLMSMVVCLIHLLNDDLVLNPIDFDKLPWLSMYPIISSIK